MKKSKDLEELKNSYMNIDIPSELDNVVNNAINSSSKNKKSKNITKWSGLAASMCIVIGCINLSPIFANTLQDVHIIGNVIKVMNFRNYSINENGFEVSIDVPKIEGLGDKELEYKLNKTFEEDGKKLYDEYTKELEALKNENTEGRKLVESWYEVKEDNDNILSLVVYNHYAQGSSNTTRKFYNIDKKNKTILTLEGMFGGTDYINIISENIKNQMRERVKNNKEDVYWIDGEFPEYDFDEIHKNQGFYINHKNELVICFDKYEVAPGASGLTEFAIPKAVIEPLIMK